MYFTNLQLVLLNPTSIQRLREESDKRNQKIDVSYKPISDFNFESISFLKSFIILIEHSNKKHTFTVDTFKAAIITSKIFIQFSET